MYSETSVRPLHWTRKVFGVCISICFSVCDATVVPEVDRFARNLAHILTYYDKLVL